MRWREGESGPRAKGRMKTCTPLEACPPLWEAGYSFPLPQSLTWPDPDLFCLDMKVSGHWGWGWGFRHWPWGCTWGRVPQAACLPTMARAMTPHALVV